MAFDGIITKKSRQTEIAEEAATLIRNGWAKRYCATDKNGIRTDIRSEDATNFCAIGALARATRLAGDFNVSWELEGAFAAIVGVHPVNYNDYVAKDAEDVAKIFDQIARNNPNGLR